MLKSFEKHQNLNEKCVIYMKMHYGEIVKKNCHILELKFYVIWFRG